MGKLMVNSYNSATGLSQNLKNNLRYVNRRMGGDMSPFDVHMVTLPIKQKKIIVENKPLLTQSNRLPELAVAH